MFSIIKLKSIADFLRLRWAFKYLSLAECAMFSSGEGLYLEANNISLWYILPKKFNK